MQENKEEVKEIAKEIVQETKVGLNTTARRRRNRRRRRRNKNRQPARYVHRENVKSQKVKEYVEQNNGKHQARLLDILDPTLVTYCEAITNPFGSSAIGALLPDKYHELVIPATDRLDFDLGPASFNVGSADWTIQENSRLLAAIIWFRPRCLDSGELLTNQIDNVPDTFVYPYLGINNQGATNPLVAAHAYNLCFYGLWSTTAGTQVGVYDGETATGVSNYYKMLAYPRRSTIAANTTGVRILGAGIKAWSEEAPINTGGYSVGGWISHVQMLQSTISDASTAALEANMRFVCRTPGIKGSTVRYSPLQSPTQIESQSANVLNNQFIVTNGTNQEVLSFQNGVAPVAMDMCNPNDFVPVIYWKYNNSASDTGSITDGVYTLKLMSTVHLEGIPDGSCPFMTTRLKYDPAVDEVSNFLQNPEVFPPATKGHSFKSFITKANHIMGIIHQSMSKVMAVGKLLESFF